MAYTFDRINTMFRGRDQNADVMGDKRGGSYGALKTSASGDVTDGSTGAATSTGGEAPVPQSMMASSGAAIKRNVARAGVPGFTQNIQSQIQAGQTGLTNAANTYRQGYENRDYGVSAADINAAVAGNAPDTFEKVKTRLATPKYGQVEAFKPEVDTEIEDAALLGSEQGTKRLLARSAGNRYSAGEGAFDVSLLRRNKDFSQIADQLARQGKELSQKATKLQSELPEQAQKVADTKYEAGTTAAKQELDKLATGITSPIEAKVATINAGREAKRKAPDQAFITAQDAAAKAQAAKDLAILNPRAAKLLDQTGIDPSKYYSVGQNVSAADLYTPENAAQFNRIQQMLGSGNLIVPGAGAGEDQYFAAPDYTSGLVSRATALRGTKDIESQNVINKIMADAAARSGEYNQSIEAEENKALEDAKFNMAAELAGIDPQYLRDLQSGKIKAQAPANVPAPVVQPNYSPGTLAIDLSGNAEPIYGSIEPSPYKAYSSQLPDQPITPGTLAIGQGYDPFSQITSMLQRQFDPNQVINRRARTQAGDVLSPEEAAQINAAIEDLGSVQPKAKGSTDWRKPVSLNTDALRRLLAGS